MPALYRKQYLEPWTFTKPGVVLLKENSIIVLEEGKHLTSARPVITTDEANAVKYGLPSTVTFEKSFDVINPGQTNIISTFILRTTAAGDTLLAVNNLQAAFPAVVQGPGEENTYYFTGDFANNEIPFWTSRFKGIEKIKGPLFSDNPEDGKRFFWLYYRPLLNGIFTEYYTSSAVK
jgi:hypothetical protein